MQLHLGIAFHLCWQNYAVNNHLNACHTEQHENKPQGCFSSPPDAFVNLSRMTLYDLCISHCECQHG